MIEVVSAVIVRDGRILLTQRMPPRDYAFRWESPGGKVGDDLSESHHSALRREMREELGVELGPIGEHAIFCREIERGDAESVFVMLYPTSLAEGSEPRPLEGQGIGWFTEIDLPILDLAPCNHLARRELVSHMRAVARAGR